MNQRLRDWWCRRFGHDWVAYPHRVGFNVWWTNYCNRCGNWAEK